MAKNLPGLVIKIGANTKDAIDGLNKVNRAVGKSATGGERLRASWAKAGPAIAAAGVAVGALAIKLGSDAVAAAKEEEVSVGRLAQTLKNLGLATADTRVETFIDDMQFATGIADNDLRPAMDRLVRSTGNVAEAQRALQIAADIATAKQRNVVDVANILGKAYDGNTMALGRLGVGLDKSVLKSGDMAKITSELSRLFSGQAAAAADTVTGRMNILTVAVDELSESLGKGLIGTGEDSKKAMQDLTQRLRDAQPQAEQLGADVRNVGLASLEVYDNFRAMGQALSEGNWSLVGKMISANSEELQHLNRVAMSTGEQFEYLQYQAYETFHGYGILIGNLSNYVTAAESATKANDGQTASLKRLQSALSGLDSKQSVMEKRFGLQQLIAKGPGKTIADQKQFAFAIASQSRDLASELLGQGKRGQARGQLAQARSIIRSLGLSSGFEGNLIDTLATPSALRSGSRSRAGTPQTGAQVGAINNYYFTGGITVDSSAAAQQAAKQATRLAALSGRYAGKSIPVG